MKSERIILCTNFVIRFIPIFSYVLCPNPYTVLPLLVVLVE